MAPPVFKYAIRRNSVSSPVPKNASLLRFHTAAMLTNTSSKPAVLSRSLAIWLARSLALDLSGGGLGNR